VLTRQSQSRLSCTFNHLYTYNPLAHSPLKPHFRSISPPLIIPLVIRTLATMADESAAADQQVTFTIKSSSDQKHVVTVSLSSTVGDLKQKLATADYANIPVERQRLIYSGRVLKDPDTLSACKIKEGNTVHLVKGAESNQRQNPANQGGSATSAGAGGSPANNVPQNIQASMACLVPTCSARTEAWVRHLTQTKCCACSTIPTLHSR
jgi:hypothetical protein